MIYIIRHGQTEMNQRKVLQGWKDYPLNDTGIEQARKAAEKLNDIKFVRVFSSPLQRAIKTADIVAPDVEPVIDRRLIEMGYGKYEGASLYDLPPEIVEFFKDFSKTPEGMEQLDSVVSRTGEFIEDIKGLEGNILISTHAVAMKGILEYLTPDANGKYWGRFIDNCDVYVAENKDGQISVPRLL